MYSSNAPSSLAPGGMSRYDQQHFQASSTIDVYSQPTSQGDLNHGQGNSLNQFEEAATYRGLGQPTVIVDNNSSKPPSFTQVNQGDQVMNSYNQYPNLSHGLGGNSSGYSASGQAPSMSAMVKVNVSHTSGGDLEPYSKAPGISDVDQRGGSSQTGALATVKSDVPNAQELMGISLVGNTFWKFYPNAYHKEGDDEN